MILLNKGDSGSYVFMLQLALARAGEAPGEMDGIFGERTLQATQSFQQKQNLVPDGIVGRKTFAALRPYLVGYTTYQVQPGNTVFALAQRFGSSVALIENANPKLRQADLMVGDTIYIPYNFELVPTNVAYNSLLCELICEGLAVRYPFIGLQTVGKSKNNRPLVVLKLGHGKRELFFNAAHHANEWITTPMVLRFTEQYANAVVDAVKIGDAFAEYLFDTVTLYVMPMVDPDGVDLVTGALLKDSAAYKTAVGYAGNYPQIPFPSGWKANLAGVDLNLNYPAMWERARELKFAAGYQKPGPRDYVGPKPLSEPESTAVFNFTQSRSFAAVLAFHTQGEVIYQGFERYLPPGSAALAARLARASGYAVENAPAYSGYAGYKDWFILSYNLPGYTVEVGQGVNPLPISSFNRFYPPAAALMAAALQGISAGEETPESTE